MRAAAAILVCGAMAVACGPASGRVAGIGAARTTDRETVLRGLLHARSGVLLVADPADCSIGRALVGQLNALAKQARLNVHVAFVGVSRDPVQHTAIRKDLGLEVPSTIVDMQAIRDATGLQSATVPFAVVVGNGRVHSALFSERIGWLVEWVESLSNPVLREVD